jgi:hypothetical protein
MEPFSVIRAPDWIRRFIASAMAVSTTVRSWAAAEARRFVLLAVRMMNEICKYSRERDWYNVD